MSYLIDKLPGCAWGGKTGAFNKAAIRRSQGPLQLTPLGHMTAVEKIPIADLVFNCRVSGDKQNELIIFLHGFPETSHMWRRLMDRFSSLGYYCMAPDMRGYSPDACPGGSRHYKLARLGQDVLDLADAAGKHAFHLVGHDWGAVIGWHVAFHSPGRIQSWTALSVPHNRAFAHAFRNDGSQRQKSRYIRWFLLPVLPELMLRKNDFEKFKRLWKHSTPEEVEDYLSVFRSKRSLTAALNYYRANIGKGKFERVGDIEVPTLFIWGRNDLAIGSVAAEGCHKYVKGPFTYVPLDGGHWLIQSNYTEVETAVQAHISKYKA